MRRLLALLGTAVLAAGTLGVLRSRNRGRQEQWSQHTDPV
jgi:outer membrane biogenesis lipoprotein LolB